MSDIDEALYIKTLSQYLWERKVYELVDKYRKPSSITEKSWKLSCSCFSLDRANFPEMEKDIQASLIRHVCDKTGMTPETLYSIFHEASYFVETTSAALPKLSFRGNTALVGTMSVTVPPSFKERVSGTEAQKINLLLRYRSLGVDTGMFWSLDPEIMRGMQLSSEGDERDDVLECFASPFNYTLRHFCSPFEEDKELGYYGSACHGDFFSFIRTVTNPLILLVNPPFTDRLISKTADSLIDYYSKYPESSMLVTLPDWDNEGIDRLRAMKGTTWQKAEYGDFFFYDAVEEMLIRPYGISVIVLTNVESDSAKSQKLLDSVLEYMLV